MVYLLGIALMESFQPKKVQTEVLDEFLFADDMAKGAPTEEKMQTGVDQVSDALTAMTSQSASKRPKWFINQHLASLTRRAHHYSERSKIASGRQVHLPWKHIVKSRAH